MVNGNGSNGKHPGYPYLHNRYHPMSDPFYPNGNLPLTNGSAYPQMNQMSNYNNYTNNAIENGFRKDQSNYYTSISSDNHSGKDRSSTAVFAPKYPVVMRTDHIDYTSKQQFTYAEEPKGTQPPPPQARPLPLPEPTAMPKIRPTLPKNDEEPRYVAMLEPSAAVIPEQPRATEAIQNAPAPVEQPQWMTMDPASRSNSSVSSSSPLINQKEVLNPPQQPKQEVLRAPTQDLHSNTPSVLQNGDSDPNKRYSVIIGGLKPGSISNDNVGQGAAPGISITSADSSRMSATVQITSDATSRTYDTMQGKLSNAPHQNGTTSMPGYTFNNISS